jgi:hypothetical protein
MKKVTITICFAVLQIGLLSAQTVKIGNTKFVFKQGDTIFSIRQAPEKIHSSDSKPESIHYSRSSGYIGLGFMIPEYTGDYFHIWGGNSFHLDIGSMKRYQVSRHFSLGATMQYSFYNYRFDDALSNPVFAGQVVGNPEPADRQDVYKQVYRSHNVGASAFTRFYLVPPRRRSNSDGVYIDCGIQGNFSYSRFFKTKSNSDGSEKYRDGYAFNPLNASAYARLGWNDIAIVAHYRFTDAFNRQAIPTDLPGWSVGVQFN